MPLLLCQTSHKHAHTHTHIERAERLTEHMTWLHITNANKHHNFDMFQVNNCNKGWWVTKKNETLTSTSKSNLDGATEPVWNIKTGTKATGMSSNSRLQKQYRAHDETIQSLLLLPFSSYQKALTTEITCTVTTGFSAARISSLLALWPLTLHRCRCGVCCNSTNKKLCCKRQSNSPINSQYTQGSRYTRWNLHFNNIYFV